MGRIRKRTALCQPEMHAILHRVNHRESNAHGQSEHGTSMGRADASSGRWWRLRAVSVAKRSKLILDSLPKGGSVTAQMVMLAGVGVIYL